VKHESELPKKKGVSNKLSDCSNLNAMLTNEHGRKVQKGHSVGT